MHWFRVDGRYRDESTSMCSRKSAILLPEPHFSRIAYNEQSELGCLEHHAKDAFKEYDIILLKAENVKKERAVVPMEM